MFQLSLILPNGTKVADLVNIKEDSMLDEYLKEFESKYQTNKPQKPNVFSTGF